MWICLCIFQSEEGCTRQSNRKSRFISSNVVIITNPETRQVFGFRIVKVLAKEPAGQRELNDPRVQQAIRDQLRDRREQLLKAAYYDVVRDQAKVENYYAEQILKNTGQK